MTTTVEVWERRATYEDGSLVSVGDNIRYHQASGGMMSPTQRRLPNGEYTLWHQGTAVLMPWYVTEERRATAASLGVDVDEIVLYCDDCGGKLHSLFSHVVEKRL